MTAEGQDKMQDGAGQDRLVTAEEIQSPDPALRPQRLADFVGQGQGRANLETFIGAACLREEPMDHALLHGPPGLGKTTMAQIISSELGVGFRATSGPVIARAGDLAALLWEGVALQMLAHALKALDDGPAADAVAGRA